MSPRAILPVVERYLARYPDDTLRLSGLVDQARNRPETILLRSTMEGHVTASALVLSRDLHRVLLIDHRTLGRLQQPGGHYEDGPLAENARREAEEETGVQGLRLLLDEPIEIDSHPIPTNPAKGEGSHVHHDFLFLFCADPTLPLVAQEAEVHSAGWVDVQTVCARDPRLRRAIQRAAAIATDLQDKDM